MLPGHAAVLLTLAAAVGWATLDLLRRVLSSRVRALALVACVTLGATPPLLFGVLLSPGRAPDAGYLAPALASVLLNVAANYAYFRAFQLSPMSKSLPMLSFTPAFAAILGAVVLGETIGARGVVGLVLVSIGALTLTLAPGRGLAGFLVGLLEERGARWMIGVALLWSVTLLLDKRALAHAPPQLHALVLNIGVAIGALLVLAFRGQLGTLTAIRGSWGLLAGTVLVSAFALAMQLVALGGVELGFLETVKRGVGGILAVVFGRTLFAEAVTPWKVVAIALLTGGVALLVL